MNFENYTYERPNLGEVTVKFAVEIERFKNAASVEEQSRVMDEINKLRNDLGTMFNLCYIRHSINTNDEFYKEEQDFMDEIQPEVEGLVSQYYQALVDSKFRNLLEEKWGRQLFALAEGQLKTFKPEIVPLLQKENRLSTEYTKLLASAKIDFEGEERTLAQLEPFVESTNREMRKKASEVKFGFLADHEVELDRIYDDLVKVRTEIAQKLGYKNFVELGYYRMMRTDYNADMVANFREQVKDFIVPIATKLKKRQQERIGLDKLKYYDEGFKFLSGNAVPREAQNGLSKTAKKCMKIFLPKRARFFGLCRITS